MINVWAISSSHKETTEHFNQGQAHPSNMDAGPPEQQEKIKSTEIKHEGDRPLAPKLERLCWWRRHATYNRHANLQGVT